MMHYLKHTPSIMVTAVFVGGVCSLVATDLLGAERISALLDKLTATFTRSVDLSELEKSRGFSFFSKVPVPDAGLVVTTGVEFSTYRDLLVGQESHRWCYTAIGRDGQIPRHVTLGNQKRGEAPAYVNPSEFTADELAAVGLDARTLTRIARSACRFKGSMNDGGGEVRGSRERVALGEMR